MQNFLDAKLCPKVHCHTPATDHFEVSNLVSPEIVLRQRGFLAYSVVKPPIELEFEFLCPIRIHHIRLITTVGSKKCTGIEVLARTGTHESYIRLARTVYDSYGVIFEAKPYSKAEHEDDFHTVAFNRDSLRCANCATGIKVVIFRTHQGCVPCLGSIQVYGYGPTDLNEHIQRLLKTADDHVKPIIPTNVCHPFRIPMDFKDGLTLELMTNPVTLPSGATVDSTSLQKHIDNEQLFGRKPCDPFTGLEFTATRKPLRNVALKGRIDMWLLENSNSDFVRCLSRPLGSNCTAEEYQLMVKKCVSCNENGLNQMYSLDVCLHVFCRQCLLELMPSLTCSQCNLRFTTANVKRIHS